MKQIRHKKHGDAPYKIIVVHGGPGAPGSVAPLAKELSKKYGVLEPYQTADSVEGQITELKTIISEYGQTPAVLIGHSWGAFLGWMVSARYPELVKKLILVGSGVFEKQYADNITSTRINRLNKEERLEVEAMVQKFNNPNASFNNNDFSRLGSILTKADIYQPIDSKLPDIDAQFDIYMKVWPDAETLRNSGRLLEMGMQIQCPVVAIHGDYDPHPPEGVKIPLTKALKKFKFIHLKKCGHYPWLEKHAAEEFYTNLEEVIH